MDIPDTLVVAIALDDPGVGQLAVHSYEVIPQQPPGVARRAGLLLFNEEALVSWRATLDIAARAAATDVERTAVAIMQQDIDRITEAMTVKPEGPRRTFVHRRSGAPVAGGMLQ